VRTENVDKNQCVIQAYNFHNFNVQLVLTTMNFYSSNLCY